MTDQIDSLRQEIASALAKAASLEALEAVRVDALGRKGRVTELMKDLGSLAPDARKARGQAVNALKDEITAAIEARKETLSASALDAKLASERIDVTL
jgi:phenylalanyl-tRNA synthetase alpha chain